MLRALELAGLPPKSVLYVATGYDVIQSQEFQEFRESTSMVVVTKEDVVSTMAWGFVT